ncbi:MAG: hypothetical protein MJZ50_00015 [Treponema sp.]|nr:hypothetical protein [Treponema sp.]
MNRKNFIPLILLAFVPLFSWSQPGFGCIESLCICQDGLGGACIVSTERNEAGEIFHQLYRRKNDGGREPAGVGFLVGVENAGFGSISYFDEEFCIEESFDLAHGEISSVLKCEADFYSFFILETGSTYFYIMYLSQDDHWTVNRIQCQGGIVDRIDASAFSASQSVIFYSAERALWMCRVDESFLPVSFEQVSGRDETVAGFGCCRGRNEAMGFYLGQRGELGSLCFYFYDSNGRFRRVMEDVESLGQFFDLDSSRCFEDVLSGRPCIASSRGILFVNGNSICILGDGKAIDGFNSDVKVAVQSEISFIGESYYFDGGNVIHEKTGGEREILDGASGFVRTSMLNSVYYCAFVREGNLCLCRAGGRK